MTTETDVAQRFWEDVQEGDAIEGFELLLDWTKMVAQVSGSQDFYRVHHDPDFAAEAGHETIFYNTGFTQAMLCRAITDWMGPEGWLRKFRFEMRRMLVPNDTVRARGTVVGKSEGADGMGAVELELSLGTQREDVTTPAWATVLLPKRG